MALIDGVKVEEEDEEEAEKGTKTGFRYGNNGNSFPGTSLASVESLSMPLVQEVVLSADIRCAKCQKRIADIMSRLNETESVLVNVSEKKVILTCRYPAAVVKASAKQTAAIYRYPLGKIAMIKRIFRSSSSST